MKYNGNDLWKLKLGSFFGGIVGAFGLGGGVVFNPLLLSLGVLPQVTTSTAMYMILFGTTASTLVYISIGALVIPYAALIGFSTTIGIIIGLKVIKQMIEKYNRPSIIVFILSFILAASAIMVPVFNFSNLLK